MSARHSTTAKKHDRDLAEGSRESARREEVDVDLTVAQDELRDEVDPTREDLTSTPDPADLDEEGTNEHDTQLGGPELGDLSYSEIDADIEDRRDVTRELDEFLDQAGDVGGLDGRNDADAGGMGNRGPDESGPDLMGAIQPGIGGANAKLSEWQQDWLHQMQAKATEAADNADDKAANDIAAEVKSTLDKWYGRGEESGGALYHDKVRFDENEGIQGVKPSGNGQVYPPGSEAQRQLDAAELQIREDSRPAGGGTKPNELPADQGGDLPDHFNDPGEGWGTGEDPFDQNDGHTDPVDQGIEETYDGPPPTMDDMVDLTAQYEEGYVPPADVTGNEIDPDGHLDPYFDEADG